MNTFYLLLLVCVELFVCYAIRKTSCLRVLAIWRRSIERLCLISLLAFKCYEILKFLKETYGIVVRMGAALHTADHKYISSGQSRMFRVSRFASRLL
jgi:uncharacterized protein YqhQ